MLNRLRRVAAFAALPAVGLLSSLAALPAISARYGQEGWSTIALGLSLGSAAGVVVELGWSLNGPMRVARASPHARARIYAVALISKLMIFPALAAIAAVLALRIGTNYPADAAFMAIAATCAALSPVWFFVGTGKPTSILYADAIPRTLLSVLAAFAIAIGAPLGTYPLSQLLAALLAPLIGLRLAAVTHSSLLRHNFRFYFRVVRAQSVVVAGRLVSALYMSLPVTIVTLVSPTNAASFAAVDRLVRMVLQLLTSVPNSLQNWVGMADNRPARLRRVYSSIRFSALIGVSAGVAFTFLAPVATKVLFSGTINLTIATASLGGLIILLSCTSRATGGIGLVAVRDMRSISVSAACGALLGLSLLFALASSLGTPGALIGQIGAEILVLAIQSLMLRRRIRGRPSGD